MRSFKVKPDEVGWINGMKHGHVVLCGTDPVLLRTRRDVLRHSGFDVFTASSLKEIEALLQNDPLVSAMVVCHTFEPPQQEAALTVLLRWRPTARSIVLTKNTTREMNAQPDALVSTAEGPETLIQTLDRLLNRA